MVSELPLKLPNPSSYFKYLESIKRAMTQQESVDNREVSNNPESVDDDRKRLRHIDAPGNGPFPSDIVTVIFGHMENDSRLATRLVCRDYRTASLPSLTRLHFRYKGWVKAGFGEQLQKLTNLRSLSLDLGAAPLGRRFDDVLRSSHPTCLRHLNALTLSVNLCLSRSRWGSTPSPVVGLSTFAGITNLTRLCIIDMRGTRPMTSLLAACPYVVDLELDFMDSSSTVPEAVSAIRGRSSLKRLCCNTARSLGYFEARFWQPVLSALDGRTTLVTLEVSGWQSDISWLECVAAVPHLTRLAWAFLTARGSYGGDCSTLSRLTNLQTLELYVGNGDLLEGLEIAAESWRYLGQLVLHWQVVAHAEVYTAMHHLRTTLTRLDVGSSVGPSIEELVEWLPPGLQHLAGFYERVPRPDLNLPCLHASFAGLTVLDVEITSPDAHAAFISHLPALRSLACLLVSATYQEPDECELEYAVHAVQLRAECQARPSAECFTTLTHLEFLDLYKALSATNLASDVECLAKLPRLTHVEVWGSGFESSPKPHCNVMAPLNALSDLCVLVLRGSWAVEGDFADLVRPLVLRRREMGLPDLLFWVDDIHWPEWYEGRRSKGSWGRPWYRHRRCICQY
eukprot:jgi/Botrbrau1/6330/Bobra.0339s0037.1